MLQLLLNITERGVAITRCDGLVPDFTITVEQQAENPKLGLIGEVSSLSGIKHILSDAISEGTGQKVTPEEW